MANFIYVLTNIVDISKVDATIVDIINIYNNYE